MHYKVILLDADGVCIEAPQRLPYTFPLQRGLDSQQIKTFFAGPFQAALRGAADLKDLITQNPQTWGITGDPQPFLDEWFAAENIPSVALLPIIQAARGDGRRVYLVTNQEKYRAAYLRRVMFANIFDDILASCEIGAIKSEPEFWAAALARIAKDTPDASPGDILYLDDSPAHITIAQRTGIDSRVYTGPEQLVELLQA